MFWVHALHQICGVSGLSSTPLSISFSQRSHQLRASCRNSILCPGKSKMGVFVNPWAHASLYWCAEIFDKIGKDIFLGVRQTPTAKSCSFDRKTILAQRNMLPIGVARLMFEQYHRQIVVVFQSRGPHVTPAISH